MPKQPAITMLHSVPHRNSVRTHLKGIITKLEHLLVIPTGYQDESGFHYGVAPGKKEIQWPPAD